MRRGMSLIAVLLLSLLAAAPAMAATLDEVKAGNSAFADHRYEAAVEAYTRAILAGDLDPEALAVTFNNRGVAYGELGDYDHAILDYGQALSLKPADRTSTKNLRIAYAKRAAAHARLGEYDPALGDYAKAIELDPEHAASYVQRGQLYLERGDLHQAVADLEKAKELDPNNKDAGQLLARAESGLAAATQTASAAPAGSDATTTTPPPEPPAIAAAPPAAPAPAQAPVTSEARAPVAAAKPAKAHGSTAARPPVTTEAEAVEPGAGAATASRPAGRVSAVADQPYRARQAVNYRDGPSNDAPRGGTLAAGTVVTVIGESQGWLKFRLQSGKEGFIYQRWLEPVQP